MKNLFLLPFFLVFTSLTIHAQYDAGKVNKKAIESYNKAIEKAQDGKLKDAIESLEEAIKRDAKYIDAYLSLAGIHGQLKDHAKSVAQYEKAFALDPEYTFTYRLPYSINLAGLGRFDKALTVIDELLTRKNLHPNTQKAAEYRKKTYEFALDFEKKNAGSNYVFKPVNMGDAINSAESEYFPSMPVDGGQMIYTRRLNGFNEDFFGTRKDGEGWSQSTRLNGSINTALNEGAQNISQDGNWLVFTGCNREDGMGSCDLYISYLTNTGWSEAINLGRSINSDSWESQPSLSPDKRDLYFSSNRPGGYGGSDIYVSRMGPNGKWGTPVNLGPEINTSGDESSPFIHADNQTLYFASNGLPGYGEEDLFMAKRDSTGRFAKPLNLGYPINTINHEGTIFIAADGKTAYYASDRSDSRGGLDIYSFELREDIRPVKTLWVKGKVFDRNTKAGLPSTVELIDLESKFMISRVQTDESGNYLITLPVGKDYAFNVSRRGYLFYSDHYSLKQKDPDSTYEKDIPLQPIEVDAAIVLNNIFFDVNKFELKPASTVELDNIVLLLKENPTVKVQIEGHTDNAGSAADNQKLSENRARAVIFYLTGKGIRPERMVAKGFGATKPVGDNNTEPGRAANRRTELKILEK
jgi:outer membrane protein OmpA-like peptidoglycan-associated protein/tetratricopeptide (TPR) repeat protein